jgi:hypothetical protein
VAHLLCFLAFTSALTNWLAVNGLRFLLFIEGSLKKEKGGLVAWLALYFRRFSVSSLVDSQSPSSSVKVAVGALLFRRISTSARFMISRFVAIQSNSRGRSASTGQQM